MPASAKDGHEPRPSRAGLKPGTPEYKAAHREYERWRNKYDTAHVTRKRVTDRSWYEQNRTMVIERQWATRLQTKYGITAHEYNAMLEAQGGVCAICEGPSNGRGRYHVDHCHDVGHVRGLLCHSCNISLGHFRHDPAVIDRAAAYLRQGGRANS